jgi:hypothetical protein
MAFSPQTIKELYQQMAYHQRQVAILNQLLADVEPPRTRKSAARLAAAPKTFRGKLRGLIEHRPGITRSGLMELLKTANDATLERSRLRPRISSELWHMVRRGQIERTSEGGYRLREAA